MTALNVDAWLVCDNHAGQERRGTPLHAELVKVDAFVNRHKLPHPMSCSMQIIDAVFPHGFTRKSIELSAAGAFGEDR